MKSTALHFLILTVAGWMNRRQLDVVEYLIEENRVVFQYSAQPITARSLTALGSADVPAA